MMTDVVYELGCKDMNIYINALKQTFKKFKSVFNRLNRPETLSIMNAIKNVNLLTL